MDKSKFITIDINSDTDLLKAFDMLHDSITDRGNIVYNESKNILDIYFERDFFESDDAIKVKRKFLIFGTSSYPIIKTQLHLQEIASFENKIEDINETTFQFNECQPKGKIYNLKFTYRGLVLKLSFQNRPIGFFRDLEFVREATYNTFVWPWGKP